MVSEFLIWNGKKMFLSLATKHSCPYCTQIFSTPSGVKRHIIYRHTDIKYFQCPDCSLSCVFA